MGNKMAVVNIEGQIDIISMSELVDEMSDYCEAPTQITFEPIEHEEDSILPGLMPLFVLYVILAVIFFGSTS